MPHTSAEGIAVRARKSTGNARHGRIQITCAYVRYWGDSSCVWSCIARSCNTRLASHCRSSQQPLFKAHTTPCDSDRDWAQLQALLLACIRGPPDDTVPVRVVCVFVYTVQKCNECRRLQKEGHTFSCNGCISLDGILAVRHYLEVPLRLPLRELRGHQAYPSLSLATAIAKKIHHL